MLFRRIATASLYALAAAVMSSASMSAGAPPAATTSKAVAAPGGQQDALDSLMTDSEQRECGVNKLMAEERLALVKVLLKAYDAGQAQPFIVMSSYGSFTAGLVEFTGSKFIFDLNPIEMQRLKRAAATLEWLPESRLVLFPYQVTWIRR